jgi:geranylgeranyl reductase family protein
MLTGSDYDAVVVGAGPAGATAAYALSRGGLRVLILDKRPLPRDKLCGGIITAKTVMMLQRLFGETAPGLQKQGVFDYTSNDYEALRRSKPVGRFRAQQPFFFVKRATYDAFLVEKARAAGADLVDDQAVIEFDPESNELVTAQGLRPKARFIVGADGTRSVVRLAFPPNRFDPGKWHRGLAVALQVCTGREALGRALDHPMIYFGFVRHGYCWAFPNSDRIVVGMGCLARANRPPEGKLFRAFLAEAGWGMLLEQPVRAARVPYGNFLRRPAYRDAVLVGDAAGLVDPLTGEGIYYAQRSGELAAESILESVRNGSDFRARYLELLGRHIYPHLKHRRMVRRLFFRCLPIVPGILGAFRSRALREALVTRLHGVAEETRARRRDQ